MRSDRWKANCVSALMFLAALGLNWSKAQSQNTSTEIAKSDRVSITYVPPESPTLQQVYDLLRLLT
jgi:hypothetical protein